MRRLLPLPAVLLTALTLAAPVSAASPDVVISEVYGGGGNSGATLRNDFIELFNRGTTTVDVSTWSVQYASAAGTSWQKTNLTGTIAPGQSYLVQEAAGANTAAQPLPTPDATGTIAMSGSAGKVALVTNQTTVNCGAARGSCSAVPSVRDLIGYGSTSDSEGAPAPGLTNTTSDSRAAAGCTDTDQNGADFAAGAPAPENTSSPRRPCSAPPGDAAPTVADTTPEDGASEVPTATNIDVTFSEDVAVADGGFTLSCTRSGDVAVTVTGGPRTFTLDPTQDLAAGERCTVTVRGAAVSDADAHDPPDQMAGDFSTSFTTVGLALRIHEIQGAEHRSPFEGEAVSRVPGVVTAVRSNGYYLQDTQPDADERTSEGIFVFTRTTPPASAVIGNAVLVSGRVEEFRPGGAASDNLTTTEISSPVTTPAGAGQIPPTVVGPGGRVPPTEIIDNDSMGDVETTMTFDPQQDGIDFYESLEGMLTRVNDPVAVGPTSRFGEVPMLAAGGAGASIRTARGGIVIQPTDFNPERIIFDDVIADTPVVNVHDTFAGPVDAVVDYSFGNFKFLALETPEVVDGGLEREITDAPRRDQLSIASFNVENLDAGDPEEKFRRLAETLVTNLRSPDIVGVEEVQDNDGARSAAPTDATLTYDRLITAIEAADGPTYEYRQIDPASNQDGGQPNGNIRVGFLYRPDHGVSFVDRPGGNALTSTEEDASRRGAQLTLSPGRIDPTDPAFERSRKPLAGEFLYHGRTVIAIVNHFNSKGGDDPLFGRVQPPQRSSETQRHQQATIVNRFVGELLAADKHANVVVFGDLNDFEFSRTLELLKGEELFNLADLLPKQERYSYVFEGNSQVLDQILVSRSLLAPQPEYDSVHTNSEFADQISDHDPQLARLRVTGAPAKKDK